MSNKKEMPTEATLTITADKNGTVFVNGPIDNMLLCVDMLNSAESVILRRYQQQLQQKAVAGEDVGLSKGPAGLTEQVFMMRDTAVRAARSLINKWAQMIQSRMEEAIRPASGADVLKFARKGK